MKYITLDDVIQDKSATASNRMVSSTFPSIRKLTDLPYIKDCTDYPLEVATRRSSINSVIKSFTGSIATKLADRAVDEPSLKVVVVYLLTKQGESDQDRIDSLKKHLGNISLRFVDNTPQFRSSVQDAINDVETCGYPVSQGVLTALIESKFISVATKMDEFNLGYTAAVKSPSHRKSFTEDITDRISNTVHDFTHDTRSEKFWSAVDIAGDAISFGAVERAIFTWIGAAEKFLESRNLSDEKLAQFKLQVAQLRSDAGVIIRQDPNTVHPLLIPVSAGGNGYNQKLVKEFQTALKKLIFDTVVAQPKVRLSLTETLMGKTKDTSANEIKKEITDMAFKLIRAQMLNSRTEHGFQQIDKEIIFASLEIPEATAIAQLRPAREIYEANFSASYYSDSVIFGPTQGISSGTSDSIHTTNLWESSYEITLEDGDYHSITTYRHGINSAYGLSDQTQANRSRTNEMLVALLSPEQIQAGEGGETVHLDVSSVSLVVTSDKFKKKELKMFEAQAAAFDQFQGLQTLTLPNGKEIAATIDIAYCNFGTNVASLGVNSLGGAGWTDELKAINQRYLDKLNAHIERWKESNPNFHQLKLVSTLQNQIQDIWTDESYKSGGIDPYKMTARLILVASLIGLKSCVNCKSGKDRTSVAEAEARFLLTSYFMKILPESNAPLTDAQRLVYQTILAKCGNFEVQTANTGGPGYKIGDSADHTGLTERIGGPQFLTVIEGLSRNFSS